MADLEVNTANIVWKGKLVGREHSDDMLEILKNIDKNQTGKGYGFRTPMTGWKAEMIRFGASKRHNNLWV